MDDEEKRRLLDEIIKLTCIPEIRDDEFTRYDYISHLIECGEKKCDKSTAANRLDKLVEEKKLTRREAMKNGKKVIAYSNADSGHGQGED